MTFPKRAEILPNYEYVFGQGRAGVDSARGSLRGCPPLTVAISARQFTSVLKSLYNAKTPVWTKFSDQ